MKAKTLLAATAIVLLLAACGNKGPLVMPQKPVPVEEPATPAPVDPTEPATGPMPGPPPVANPDTPAEGTDG